MPDWLIISLIVGVGVIAYVGIVLAAFWPANEESKINAKF